MYYRWNNLNESIRSGMAVLDVTIPTGYWVQQQKLDAYVISKKVRNLQRAKYNDKKVLFYFDFVRLFIFIIHDHLKHLLKYLLFFFSLIMKKHVLTLPWKDGIL